jgi:hypothetical protein
MNIIIISSVSRMKVIYLHRSTVQSFEHRNTRIVAAK